ncbi:iron export ABC transporter permease subunit FetB [Virgibacillus halodenitrificans]|uniref:ABC transporter permease n=1 Tax=Virgibacillus halodenitrificans TaxID=1482 RepID=UPI0013703884|nr:iron export ABC transporter permease subunit FetB [Virgibacillus halodenitrificans]MYL46753.1 iron export ABC transporter permease subunit FetB [Virgibacillus halodenitrificans]
MNNSEAMDLVFWQVVSAYLFILIVLAIVHIKKIPRKKLIIISTLRMTLQLILVGYILIYIFDHPHPLLTVGIILFMLGFAIFNVYQRTKATIQLPLKKMIALAMVIGISISLTYMMLIVLQLDPWYDPQIFIPIGGMIIGKTMTGVALGVNNLIHGMRDQKDKVEGALMLGASPKQAAKSIINEAFDSAMLPTINAMVGMGIVFLPGMMTGQIIAGQQPVTAVKYQIAVMLGVAGTVSITVLIFLHLAYKSFFNEQKQFLLSKRNPSKGDKPVEFH